MRQYLDILKKVLTTGKVKYPTRYNETTDSWEPVDGGVKTISCSNVVFSHEMSDGFPLVTTKPMAWRSVKVELEGFLRGITNKKWYQERGCRIWDEWANPVQVENWYNLPENILPDGTHKFSKKEIQRDLYDLGPLYGRQGKAFNQAWNEDDDGWVDSSKHDKDSNQIAKIANTLRRNPMDRRMVCSYWNPLQLKYMALPPCHWGWNVTVVDGVISLGWIQRSIDLALGAPFDIAHYGLLLLLLAKHANLTPGNLTGLWIDAHLYENQFEGAAEQIMREPFPLPSVSIEDNNMLVDMNYPFDIFKWDHMNAKLVDYQFNPNKIDFGHVAV